MDRSKLVRGIGSLVVLLGGAPAVSAQAPAEATGTLTGRITTADGKPLPQAQITVRGTTLAAVAAVDGGFRIAHVPPRAQTVQVRLLGYAPQAVAIDVPSGETLDVRVVLVANPLLLDTIAVVSDAAVTPGMRGFEERRSRGPGVFLRREDIQKMQPRLLTDVFRRVPGLQVRPVRGGLGNNVTVQARGSECPMKFYMNGSAFPLPSDQAINDFVGPEEVVGIEVYSGSSEVPPQFSVNTRCGVIMLWTRYGPERDRQR